ncbi:MAG: hypothetical protein HQ556_11585 [Candidatus Marinimicrobia bacterium]|nr:hypothetical protein [Candidatus Neomarinimicrobiota bacterium]
MENTANKIADILHDYRSNDGIRIDINRILTWANQFEVNDRKFLLEELLNILPKSYLSKPDAISGLKESLEFLTNKYGFDETITFLQQSHFLNLQADHKSQSVLLEFLNDLTKSEYGVDIKKGNSKAKYWVYLDDVFASGGSFKRDIIPLISEFGVENFLGQEKKLINLSFFLHSWGFANTKFSLLNEFSRDFVRQIDWIRFEEIENHPRINYYNPNPSFNNAFPVKRSDHEIFDEYLQTLTNADRNEEFAYRSPETPRVEAFFSSPENRVKYEWIILEKGIEIINRIEHISRPIRPLGLVPPSYKTFGAGSHAFTWRNVSNTCPLVYWWEANGWYPLFPVANRGL